MPNVIQKYLNDKIIDFINLFGCSIFMAIALMQLIPEADEFYLASGYTNYPYNGLFIIIG